MPRSVIDAVHAHIDLEAQIGGYEAADARNDALTATYRALGQLVGARPEHIAVTQSATASFASALSAIAFEPGEVILTTRNDYVSNQLQFLSLESRLGVRVRHAPDAPEGGVDVDAVERIVREAPPKVMCVTHVPTNSGLVQDAAAIGRICREHDVLYLIDACQSVGQMPVDVQALGCDFLSATSRKFLRGPRGAGFLYVSDRVLARGFAPLMIDMHGAEWIDAGRYRLVDDAKRFETFEFAWGLVLGVAEAARYAQKVGLEAIEARVRGLADRLRRGLAEIDGVRVLDRGPALCGIVSAATPIEPRSIVLALRTRGINANAQSRPSALLDFDAKGVHASLRLSPHYYNTADEVDAALEALRDVLTR